METLFTLSVIVIVIITVVAWMRVNHWTQRALSAEARFSEIDARVASR